MIIYDKNKIISIKKIANIANQYYIDKVRLLRNNFTTPTFSAINFLTSLIGRNPNNWTPKPINIDQTLEIIRKARGTNSTGSDCISMRVIKLIHFNITSYVSFNELYYNK